MFLSQAKIFRSLIPYNRILCLWKSFPILLLCLPLEPLGGVNLPALYFVCSVNIIVCWLQIDIRIMKRKYVYLGIILIILHKYPLLTLTFRNFKLASANPLPMLPFSLTIKFKCLWLRFWSQRIVLWQLHKLCF